MASRLVQSTATASSSDFGAAGPYRAATLVFNVEISSGNVATTLNVETLSWTGHNFFVKSLGRNNCFSPGSSPPHLFLPLSIGDHRHWVRSLFFRYDTDGMDPG